MPALYRMPVAYLAALAVALTWAVVDRSQRVAVPDLSPSPTVATARPAMRTSIDASLVTPAGLRRSVIVKDLGVALRDGPGGYVLPGQPLDPFAIRSVFGESASMVQVGPRGGEPEGWIPSAATWAWETRLMARPTPRAGRPPLVVWAEADCLLDALAGRACPRHAKACPTEGEEEAGPKAATPLGLPILASRSIPQPGGPPRTIFEVAVPVRDRPPPPPPPREAPTSMRPALRTIWVALAIDTSASMRANLDRAKRLGADLSDSAARSGSDLTLRLALVEFRDASTVSGFRARKVCSFGSPAAFAKALAGLEPAGGGDGSVDEAVLDGMAVALPAPPGERLGTDDHLDWPAGRNGELATKLLVLVGDAPDHARDLVRVRSLAGLARASGIAIAATALPTTFRLSRDEQARRDLQWQALADGSFRPDGPDGPVPPLVFDPTEVDRVVDRLRALRADRDRHARELAARAALEAEARVAEYVDARGRTVDRLAPTLVDRHRDNLRGRRPDPRLDGRKAPSIRRGWLAERVGDAPIVTVEILLGRDGLDIAVAELSALQEANGGDARDLEEMSRQVPASSFFAEDRGPLTGSAHLARRLGLPPGRPEGLLARTQAEFLQADGPARAALEARLRANLTELIRRRADPGWDDPDRSIDGLMAIPHRLIDF